MSEGADISERSYATKLSIIERFMEALGWIGAVVLFLGALGIIGIIAVIILFYPEYGLFLLLFGIGVSLGLGYIVIAVSEFLRTSSPKAVKCPYCGTINKTDAPVCVKCEKVLPKEIHEPPRPRTAEKI